VQGVMGASEDLSRVYFFSTAALAGAAEAGKRNLYLYEEGQPLELIVASGEEFDLILPSPISVSPRKRYARVTPDGGAALFASRGSLTEEGNLDQASGEPAAEVFRYDAEAEELLCVSCLGNGARPQGRQLKLDGHLRDYFYASLIPGWEMQLHAPRVLSEDGQRVFFNSLNALVPQDANAMQDVYEWEAPGKGECSEASLNYRPASGGCVSLISTGADPRDSEFVDASADGRDAFFLTGQSLLSQDPGQWDLYDARRLGGFPPPPPTPPVCQGEACASPFTAPPPAPQAGQSRSPGQGNLAPKKPPRCRKGAARKRGRCAKGKDRAGKHRKNGKAGKRRAPERKG